MNTIYIVPIEPIDQRYTKQWYENIPALLSAAIKANKLKYKVKTLDGVQLTAGTTSGAFLDFGATNVYKASQTQLISEMFSKGEIKAGDKFLVTDAWNFVITAIRYQSDLLDIPVEIHGIWHAGAYDPSDILGYKMSKPWPWFTELGWFHACTANYYATEFHRTMFLNNLEIDSIEFGDKILAEFGSKAIVSGQPHDPIIAQCEQYASQTKKEMVIWPHRYNDDKQPKIIEDLKKRLDPEVVITQKLNLNKSEFYEILGEASVVFSCSLHENLGISQMEGTLAGAIPVVPDRCSYSEMYLPEFKYPSVWTESLQNYKKHKSDIVDFISDRVYNRSKYITALAYQTDILKNKYLNANVMINNILGIL